MFDYFWHHNLSWKDVLDYSPPWIAGIEENLLKSPEQVCPSPVYPVWHVRTCDPMVLVQLTVTSFQWRFLEYDAFINLFIFNIECDSCRQWIVGRYVLFKRKLVNENVQHFVLLLSSGIKDFHFLPLVKNIKAGVTALSKQTNQQTKKERTNLTNIQTNTSKLTFLKVITRQLKSKGLYLCSSVHLR